MIDLLGDDGRSLFGIRTALDAEGVPYRRIARVEDFDAAALVVAGGSFSADIEALTDRVPSVVFGLPVSHDPAQDRSPVRRGGGAYIALAEAIWPARVRRIAQRFGISALQIPRARIWDEEPLLPGSVVASYSVPGNPPHPAIVRCAHAGAPRYWSLIDLGEALANLLDERYCAVGVTNEVASRRAPRRLPRSMLALYYRVPDRVRMLLQQRTYARLCRRLVQNGDRASPSTYPIDPTGWLLIELIMALVRAAAGPLIRLARWPSPYVAAAAITHDLEPSRYAYTQGLDRLLGRLAHSRQPATIGVVVRSAARHLAQGTRQRLRRHEIMCHGLEHRGETVIGAPDEIARHVADARARLEEAIGCWVRGFRSPRLDRSPALLWALDRAGFAYDSSYPDVDRENLSHFGTGVRLNVPFRPPVHVGARSVRPSRCLEMPVSAPDCIQPLFFRGSRRARLRALATAVSDKIAYIEATEGLYVGIVHAGVFGPRDAARRGAHLGFVRRRLQKPGWWLTSAGAIAEWWQAREALRIRMRGGVLDVYNRGRTIVHRARIVLENRDGASTVLNLPALQPNESLTIDCTRVAGAGHRITPTVARRPAPAAV